MIFLGMIGPFDLTKEEINKNVARILPGNYALGKMSEDGAFLIYHIGRSDADVNKRLQEWIGKYEKFKFSYAISPEVAFDKECQNFHACGGSTRLDNNRHPQRPDHSNWKCPVCDIYG